MRLRVKGFQSIREEATILIEGFTCLTGESNRGKSAFIRATKAAFSNRLGCDFITVGQESCEVGAELLGHTLVWEKSKKGTVYTIDNKKFTKVGRTAPEELDFLGIREITTQDKKRHWPQIQGQQDPYFIVGEPSPATTAELIGATSDSMVLTRAIKLAKDDSSKAKSLEELLNTQAQTAKTRLEALVPFKDALVKAQEAAEKSFQNHQECSGRVDILEDLYQELRKNRKAVEATAGIRELALPFPPDPARLTTLLNLLTRFQKVTKVLSVEVPTNIPSQSKSSTETCLGKFKLLEDLSKKRSSILLRLGALKEASSLEQPSNAMLLKTFERVGTLVELQSRCQKLGDKLKTLSQVTKIVCVDSSTQETNIQRTQNLIKWSEDSKKLRSSITSLENELSKVAIELKRIDQEREVRITELSSIDYCILCGSDLQPGQAREHLTKVGVGSSI